MSRQSTLSSQKNLTLTEELEKLEQSITLTLQEIDANFSRAHRIVTSSILPVVEKYSEQSDAVWEGSKFWKQFFEASANVSLSSYEEGAPASGEGDGGEEEGYEEEETATGGEGEEYEEETITSAMTPSQSAYTGSPSQTIEQKHQQGETPRSKPRSNQNHQIEDSLLSTPRNPPPTKPQIAGFSSPYESLKRELRGSSPPMQDSEFPSTPRNPGSSPMKAASNTQPRSTTTRRKANPQKTPSMAPNKDVMLHRVLDKNYRLAATPLTTTASKSRRQHPLTSGNPALPHRTTSAAGETPSTTRNRKPPPSQQNPHLFDSLDSSPAAPPAPTLNADLFKSPGAAPSRRYIGSGVGGGRIPGMSVLSSAKKRNGLTPRRQQPQQPQTRVSNVDEQGEKEGLSEAEKKRLDEWNDDDDDDLGNGEGGLRYEGDEDEDTDGDLLQGMSPPKTIQFHIPQSRLLQTPAREASKRIVEDLLLTAAGGDPQMESIDGAGKGPRTMMSRPDDDELEETEDDSSPSIVKPSRGILEDDTF